MAAPHLLKAWPPNEVAHGRIQTLLVALDSDRRSTLGTRRRELRPEAGGRKLRRRLKFPRGPLGRWRRRQSRRYFFSLGWRCTSERPIEVRALVRAGLPCTLRQQRVQSRGFEPPDLRGAFTTLHPLVARWVALGRVRDWFPRRSRASARYLGRAELERAFTCVRLRATIGRRRAVQRTQRPRRVRAGRQPAHP